jgi:FK506-binding nuclear protein
VITPNGLEIRITNVALGASLADEKGRTTVQFTYDPAPQPEDLESDAGSAVGEKVTTVLCSLTPGKVLLLIIPPPSFGTNCRIDRTSDC